MKRLIVIVAVATALVLVLSSSAYAAELLTNGDFESGNGVGFTSGFAYRTAEWSLWDPEQYGVGPSVWWFHHYWSFGPYGDHTTEPTATGNMMVVNGSIHPNVKLWESTASVTPGRVYTFSFWASLCSTLAPPALDLYANGTKVTSFAIAGDAGEWRQYSYKWDSGSSTAVTLRLVSTTLVHSGNDYALDDFSLQEFVQCVCVDIKPNSCPNGINNDGHGTIPVAILGCPLTDVTKIDPASVTLDGMAVRFKGKSDSPQASYEDVNCDGYMDLVVHIVDVDGAFTEGQTVGTVCGLFKAGGAFCGTDTLKIAPTD